MASYLTAILNQQRPLDPHEVADLQRWLTSLEEECRVYGAAEADVQRMNAIRAQIELNSGKIKEPN